jgi:archaemetzincin
MLASSKQSEIKIVPIGDVDNELLEYLTLTLPGMLNATCALLPQTLDPRPSYNADRRQYHSTNLLARLEKLSRGAREKVLGITAIDLFIPIFTFVFGEAQVGGPLALMSIHRLQQQFYGLPEDEALLFARAEKEATHELGHAFGLPHCRSLDCVMRFSNSVEEVDLKPCKFCQLCEARLGIPSGATLAA